MGHWTLWTFGDFNLTWFCSAESGSEGTSEGSDANSQNVSSGHCLSIDIFLSNGSIYLFLDVA